MIAAFLRSLFRYAPIRHTRWELTLLRIILGLLVWDTYSGWIGTWTQPLTALEALLKNPWSWDMTYQTQHHPNGLAAWFDLTWLARDTIELPLRITSIASLIAYMAGVPAAYSLALPLVFGVLCTTLSNSQGAIGHTAQVLHLVLLFVWLGGIWSELCRWRGKALPQGLSAGQWQADLARQAVAATYVVSAITKLRLSGGDWFSGAQYLALHVTKNNDMQYYDTLDPAALRLDWLPQVMMQHPTLCQVLFGIGLPLELSACLGLLNRRIAALIGLSLFIFHGTVTELMQLSFIFNKVLLLAFFIAPWWWVKRGGDALASRRKTI
jgi:hypothetical protein